MRAHKGKTKNCLLKAGGCLIQIIAYRKHYFLTGNFDLKNMFLINFDQLRWLSKTGLAVTQDHI